MYFGGSNGEMWSLIRPGCPMMGWGGNEISVVWLEWIGVVRIWYQKLTLVQKMEVFCFKESGRLSRSLWIMTDCYNVLVGLYLGCIFESLIMYSCAWTNISERNAGSFYDLELKKTHVLGLQKKQHINPDWFIFRWDCTPPCDPIFFNLGTCGGCTGQ